MTDEMTCERWIAIFEAEMLGDPPSEGERAVVAHHEETCVGCASERAAWQALATLPKTQGDPAAVVEAVLRADLADRKPEKRLFTWRRVTALTLAAAAIVIAVLSTRRRPIVPDGPSVGAHLDTVSGDVAVDGVRAVPGESLGVGARVTSRGGSACFLVEPAVRVCLDKGATLSIGDLALAHRRIDVTEGHVVASLDPQPAGATFALSTRVGTVTAVGTAFSVDVDGDAVVARVLHGVVVVRAGAVEQRLSAHGRLALGSTMPGTMTRVEEHPDEALLLLQEVELSPPAPSASAVDVLSLPRSSDTAPSASASSPTPPTQSAPDMLRAARDLRAHGRYAEAARAYQELEDKYPSSDEARAALLSLGDLQIGSLNDPAGALRSFDAYLAAGGTQVQEARYRRIRALRGLGRTHDERVGIEAFLTDYPSSSEAPSLRGRLDELAP